MDFYPPRTPYVTVYPNEKLVFKDHFSSLLLSGEWWMTCLELSILIAISTAAVWCAPEIVNVKGSMPLKEIAAFFWTKALVTRVYNTYCEAIFFSFPQHRTQPSRDHALKNKKDLCGRDMKELKTIQYHDCLTLLSQSVLNLVIYFYVPGFYPAARDVYPSWWERVLRLLANHCVLSFTMYWMHRALHVVPPLWKHVHSYHHFAKHALSRNTYQDHWFDNFCNAIVGHGFAQVLVPLDHDMFWVSHLFRICESLEKHSGVSCHYNIAHSLQSWFPYAQMPHHHDWHHEGHKGSNYTFTSIGGIWDCIFGTNQKVAKNKMDKSVL